VRAALAIQRALADLNAKKAARCAANFESSSERSSIVAAAKASRARARRSSATRIAPSWTF
jgi:hypothetical protein